MHRASPREAAEGLTVTNLGVPPRTCAGRFVSLRELGDRTVLERRFAKRLEPIDSLASHFLDRIRGQLNLLPRLGRAQFQLELLCSCIIPSIVEITTERTAR